MQYCYNKNEHEEEEDDKDDKDDNDDGEEEEEAVATTQNPKIISNHLQ